MNGVRSGGRLTPVPSFKFRITFLTQILELKDLYQIILKPDWRGILQLAIHHQMILVLDLDCDIAISTIR